MARTRIDRKGHRRKGKPTNRGKFMHAEALYRRGVLTGEQCEMFERLCLDLSRLERAVIA